jgi:serine/threonine-protein kinase
MGLLSGAGILGLLMGWLWATQVVFPAAPPPDDLVRVPDLRGLPEEEAARQALDAGLSLGDRDRFLHPAVDSGVVVAQSPLPDQLASPRGPVRLTVSLGAERRPVPDVVRLRADQARTLLRAGGFEVRADTVEDRAPRGRILAVEPEPGTEVAIPGEVHLTVSAGPPLVTMPRVLGMEEAAARDTLTALGLVVAEVEEVFRFGRDRGVVVEQTPPAETTLESGSAIRLSVGRRGGRREAGTRPGPRPDPRNIPAFRP